MKIADLKRCAAESESLRAMILKFVHAFNVQVARPQGTGDKVERAACSTAKARGIRHIAQTQLPAASCSQRTCEPPL